MISPLLALSLCALAASSHLNFHRDFISRFIPTEEVRPQYTAASCAKYQCGAPNQFQPGQCVFYDSVHNTYDIQPCGVDMFCPVALDTMKNSTCIEIMPPLGPNGVLPGDACGGNNVCSGAGDQCQSGFCKGQQAGTQCGDQPDCDVGLMCVNMNPGIVNDTCQAQVQVGGNCGLPITDDNCVNNAVCINGKCVQMFSKGIGAIVSVDYAAFACSTGFFKSYPPTGEAVCLPPPVSPNVPQPQTCTPGSVCLSSDGAWSVPCECGLNPQGLAFCPPFPGDDIYQTYFNYMVQYTQSASVNNCHFLNMGQEQCGVGTTLWTNLNEAKATLDFYVRVQSNDKCVTAVYNSDNPAT